MGRAILIAAIGAAAMAGGLPAARAQPATPAPSTTTVRLTVHVASGDSGDVVPEAWLDAAVARANRLLSPGAVSFSITERKPLNSGEVVTVADRNALAVLARPRGTVHVFVVPQLADKDVPGKWLNGVHWRYSGKSPRLRGRRYVIVSATSHENTLPHELGHYFGLSHEQEQGNLMSYDHSIPVFITEAQALRIKRRLRRALSRRWLVPAR